MSDQTNRQKMAELARDKRRRRNDFATATPVEWRPMEVISPESGMPFTEQGAWLLIANLLEGDYPWHEILLERPPGQRALALIVTLPGNAVPIYIKVHMLRGMLYCRSFHLSGRKTQS
jgi:hypothetical protein